MNKTYNINVGGYPFTIDENAFEALEKYLDAIDARFHNVEGGEEIIEDIEQRMAELLQDGKKARSIVTLEDVEHAINTLGSPADFDKYEAESDYGRGGSDYKTGKKLYRDPEDQMIGGVCSGLAAYFGIQDVVWVRIAFALAFFGGGTGLLLYLVLWAIVPEARTPKDFLAMRGEPINVKNIARIVEDQVEHISDQLSDLGQDWKSKRRKKKSKRKDKKRW